MSERTKITERFPGGLRTGAQYLESLNDGRQVFVNGEQVENVATHPAFRDGARTIANLYDISCDPENQELMTFTSPKTGQPVNRVWQMPRSREDLEKRRHALERWSEESFGFMGRSPDHVPGFFVGWASKPEVFSRNGNEKGAENLIRFMEHMRDNDAYITYTIAPPQIDRSKPAHQQNPPDLYAGVVEEREDGIVIRGGQMLGTGTVYSDYVCLSTITPMAEGDENYAINVAIPCNAPGVKIYSRRGYAHGADNSTFDYPLATRYDETDSLLVFDNVFVPWENVFVYKDVDICRSQWSDTPAHVIGNNQAQTRFTTKLRFLVGLAKKVSKLNQVENLPPVKGLIAELAMHAATYEGLLDAQIASAKPNENGYYVPNEQIVYAAMMQQSRVYPIMLNLLRDLCGGGQIQLPSCAADFFNPEIRADLDRYNQSPGYTSEERVKLLKLVWDAIGSEFAGRHDAYEKFYAGAPHLVGMRMYDAYDFLKSEELVDKALSGYNLEGRINS